MVRPSCKDRILDAAEAYVLEVGAARLTIDGVAGKAGVSKGGVLYHFPTKEALLTEMLSRRMESGRQSRETQFAQSEPGPGQRVRSDIVALLEDKKEEDKCFASAILAAISNEPKMAEMLRDYHQERFALHEEESDVDFETKCLLLLAADGLFLMEVLQISPFSPDTRERLVRRLLAEVDQMAVTK